MASTIGHEQHGVPMPEFDASSSAHADPSESDARTRPTAGRLEVAQTPGNVRELTHVVDSRRRGQSHRPRRPRGLGAWGEEYACDFVVQLGMRIIERNWTCARGEIDIVALHDEFLVAIEVKTRRDAQRGSALEAVTPRKLRSVRQLMRLWLDAHPSIHSCNYLRIDVVAITRPVSGATSVVYVRDAQ